jgi:hypothetical protein
LGVSSRRAHGASGLWIQLGAGDVGGCIPVLEMSIVLLLVDPVVLLLPCVSPTQPFPPQTSAKPNTSQSDLMSFALRLAGNLRVALGAFNTNNPSGLFTSWAWQDGKA